MPHSWVCGIFLGPCLAERHHGLEAILARQRALYTSANSAENDPNDPKGALVLCERISSVKFPASQRSLPLTVWLVEYRLVWLGRQRGKPLERSESLTIYQSGSKNRWHVQAAEANNLNRMQTRTAERIYRVKLCVPTSFKAS